MKPVGRRQRPAEPPPELLHGDFEPLRRWAAEFRPEATTFELLLWRAQWRRARGDGGDEPTA